MEIPYSSLLQQKKPNRKSSRNEVDHSLKPHAVTSVTEKLHRAAVVLCQRGFSSIFPCSW